MSTLLIAGGVAANSRLRELAEERCAAAGLTLRIPRPRLCTDNGAMIASFAAHLIAAGAAPSPLDAASDPGLPVVKGQVGMSTREGGTRLADHGAAVPLCGADRRGRFRRGRAAAGPRHVRRNGPQGVSGAENIAKLFAATTRRYPEHRNTPRTRHLVLNPIVEMRALSGRPSRGRRSASCRTPRQCRCSPSWSAAISTPSARTEPAGTSPSARSRSK